MPALRVNSGTATQRPPDDDFIVGGLSGLLAAGPIVETLGKPDDQKFGPRFHQSPIRRPARSPPGCGTIHSNKTTWPRHIHHSRVKVENKSGRRREGKNMRETLLVNPFNSKQGAAQIANRLASRSTPVCAECQSDDVISYAVAQWSNESQEWQLASTFDQPAHCNGCNGPCGIVWLPLN
jgi:hypothetical protein